MWPNHHRHFPIIGYGQLSPPIFNILNAAAALLCFSCQKDKWLGSARAAQAHCPWRVWQKAGWALGPK